MNLTEEAMVATSKNNFEENLSNDFQVVLISKSSENDGQKIKKKIIEKKNIIKLKTKALSLTHSLSLSIWLCGISEYGVIPYISF